MNEALLSSKKLDWCTPADFFKELDQEFHFDLDPAEATGWGYVPHWSTCNAPDKFRKAK